MQTTNQPSQSRSSRAGMLLVLALLAWALVPMGGSAADTRFAGDVFARMSSASWGSADTGGPYTLEGGSGAFAVGSGVGSITLDRAGANRAAILARTPLADIDIRFRVRLDKLPTGGAVYVYAVARRNGTSEYRPKLILNPNGSVGIQVGVVSNGAESAVVPSATVSGLTAAPGAFIWLRARITGFSPTTIRARAWRDGATEPANWQLTATNSAAAVQTAGGFGMRAYLGGSVSNAPVKLGFDDLTVMAVDSGPTPPTASLSPSPSPTPTATLTVLPTPTPTLQPTDPPTPTESASPPTAPPSPSPSPTPTEMPTPPPTLPPPASFSLAADDYHRTEADGWGATDPGGIYSHLGRVADFSVTDGAARMLLPSPGFTRSSFLFSAVAADVELSFSVSMDKPATGAGIYVYGTLRRAVDGSAYRPKIRIMADGSVYAHVGVLGTTTETPLGSAVLVPGLTAGATDVIRIRTRADGSNPTTIQVRAWRDGQPEPTDWHFTGTDSTAALQRAGAIGMLAYVSSNVTNAPLTLTFDDLLATTTDVAHGQLVGEQITVAGDIATCTGSGDEGTARLLGMLEGNIFTLGDNAYPDATKQQFDQCYEPTWGRYRNRTLAAVGNHEYRQPGAGPYFDYFGSAAGPAGLGYYATDVGTWRVYVLNSNCEYVSCAAGSPQEQWLRADLTANPRQCTLAIWHHPRFSSGSEHGPSTAVIPFWNALQAAGAELVFSGHDHDYERFAPLDSNGALDPQGGMRQFVVGTGGAPLRSTLAQPVVGSEMRQATSSGVLKLILGATGYEWEFIPIAGQTFTDRGSGTCH